MSDIDPGIMEYYLTVKDFHKITQTFELESAGGGATGPHFKLYTSDGLDSCKKKFRDAVLPFNQ